ncbi:late endosomal/lysosomal adaptor and MAPK and MTOR activator-domain-containing protein [Truncatella angustata]|uniref:Late endosomal/lysosomal adaptor and MAPK and MTOR activator-domain-containing protein n=1 Tax=Truncatella angustata TaxID=152316 RepID=A0A9P8UBA9_9PEZI|nr:late endosomal/lysosomal adaptor and MAPK and MTOR activator-domain-containing protein [Truncatella angustata]KAH6645171.1 late endosomal/lysosomal adaptor and MAPK and MTOR activator-domain-containing protein [Truncatella angustata]
MGDDESRLLLDDPNNSQYGSFGDQNMNAQADPQESQRETEALQKVVAKTSNNLVDIFEIAPQEPQQAYPAAVDSQDVRLSRYQAILSKLSADDDDDKSTGHVDWLSDDDTMDTPTGPPSVKEGAGEPLVGTFADATAVA